MGIKLGREFHDSTVLEASIMRKRTNYPAIKSSMLTGTPRARELGLFVINGYIKPLHEVNLDIFTEVDRKEFDHK